jgi:hypothetical protein
MSRVKFWREEVATRILKFLVRHSSDITVGNLFMDEGAPLFAEVQDGWLAVVVRRDSRRALAHMGDVDARNSLPAVTFSAN